MNSTAEEEVSHQDDDVFTSGHKALHTLMQICAGVSILCALCIIGETCASHRAGTGTAASRILFCQMVWTLVCLCMLILGRHPMPEESGMWGAAGATATCTAQGFFVTLAQWAFLIWDIALSACYVCMVSCRFTETQLRKWIEKVAHVTGIIVPITFALSGLFTNSYNPGCYFCSSFKFPCDCDGDEIPCERGQHARILLLAILLVSIVTFLVSATAMIKLYCFVRRQEVRNLRCGATSLKKSTNSSTVAQQTSNPSQAGAKKAAKKPRVSRRIAIQGILYSGTFFIVALPQGIVFVIRATSDQDKGSIALAFGFVHVIKALYGVMHLGIFLRRQQEMRTGHGRLVQKLVSCKALRSCCDGLCRQEQQPFVEKEEDRKRTSRVQTEDCTDKDMTDNNLNSATPEDARSFHDDEDEEPEVEPEA